MRLLLLFPLLFPLYSSAQVSAVESLNISWFANNDNGKEEDDEFFLLRQRLDLQGNAQGMEAQARLDGARFLGAPNSSYEDDLRLERLSLSWRLGRWRIEAGDHHVQLGRGIILSLKPVEPAGIDVALRGGRLSYQDPMHDLGLFAGHSNPVNFDMLSRKFVEDTEDLIAGARYAIKPSPSLPELEFFAAWVEPKQQEGAELEELGVLEVKDRDRNWNVGGAIKAPQITDWLDLYLEADYQRRRLIDKEEKGKALYGTLDLSLGETLLLFEGIYLDTFEQTGSNHTVLVQRTPYNRPPTIERIDQEVLNTSDVQGGRLRIERSLGNPDYVAHINGMYRWQEPGKESEVQQRHGYFGFELYLPQRLSFGGGYRDEHKTQDVGGEGNALLKKIYHAEADFTWGFGSYELHLLSNNELRERPSDDPFKMKSYARGSTLLGLERANLGGLTLEYGYDTERDDVRQHFLAALIHWRINQSHDFKAVLGSQRGGIKCVGGSCREYPAFVGASAGWQGRF